MKDQIFIIEDCMGVAQGFATSLHGACLVMDELDASRPDYRPHTGHAFQRVTGPVFTVSKKQ